MVEQLVPIFRVADGSASAAWYERLGFTVEAEHRFAPGMPLYLFLRRGDIRLHLSEHTGDARPGTLAYLYVDDVAPIAAAFQVEVVDQPWGPEIELTDPDGNRVRVGSPT